MMPDEPVTTTPDIDHTLDALLSRHPAFTAHERFVRARLAELAHRAFAHGRHAAIAELLTTEQAAALLGISAVQARKLARDNQVGWNIGRDRLFGPDDVVLLRTIRAARPVGRPPQEAADASR